MPVMRWLGAAARRLWTARLEGNRAKGEGRGQQPLEERGAVELRMLMSMC